MRPRFLVAAVVIAAAVAGCSTPAAPAAVPATIRAGTTVVAGSTVATKSTVATSTTVVTRTTTVPAVRHNITAYLTKMQEVLTGAVFNGGKVPKPSAEIVVPGPDGTLNGQMTMLETAGTASYSAVQSVSVLGAGSPDSMALTLRTTSSNPAMTVDILHRASNRRRDYLLTGSAYRTIAPTAWVTVPAEFGNGLGCAVPGRKTVCEVVSDLLANQRLDPQLPVNTVQVSGSTATGKAGGTMTVTSAITVRQALALASWRLRKQTGKGLIGRSGAAELDQTLVPVVLVFAPPAAGSSSGAVGRPQSMTIDGRFTVAGTAISMKVNWVETTDTDTRQTKLPVPSKALYTVLNSAQASKLSILANAGE